MIFNDYCIIALGDTTGIKDIITEISESDVKYISQKGLIILTFTSVMFANEIKELLNENNRNFFILDLNESNNAFQIGKDSIHKDLFGGILNSNAIFKSSLFGGDFIREVTKNQIAETKASLERDLQIALESENYLEAAKIRDLIKKQDK